MSWDDAADAIQRAIVQSSGLATGKVIWKDQNVAAPSGDYIAIRFGSMSPVGLESTRTKQDLTRPLGQEIKIQPSGEYEVTLDIECFTTVSHSSSQTSALTICARVLAGFSLPTVKTILSSQGVTVFDVGVGQWIPDIPNTRFRGRAIATVRAYVPAPVMAPVADYVGYISRITGRIYPTGWSGPSGSSGIIQFDSALG